MEPFIETYNGEVDRYKRAKTKSTDKIILDDFVDYKQIKWDNTLKTHLKQERYGDFESGYVRRALYRPFTKLSIYFDRQFISGFGSYYQFFPTLETELENRVIAISDVGYRANSFSTLITNSISDYHLCASMDAHQCFPFYTYDADGGNRRENITDWALAQFRAHYGDDTISKWDIFYYVYAALHRPAYRVQFADALKRELPRIPFLDSEALNPEALNPQPLLPQGEGESDKNLVGKSLSPGGEGFRVRAFRQYVSAGRTLAALHLDYEKLDPFPLESVIAKDLPLSYRVADKMRLNKDKTALTVNPALTLRGIPAAAFDYKLGNRSALDWVIDQYQVGHDKAGQVTSDPNRRDDPQYIVRLVGQVIRVSVETAAVVAGLG